MCLIRGVNRLLALFAAGAISAGAQVNVKALVEQSVRNYESDWRNEAAYWASTETDISQSDGRKQIDISEVIPIDGTPYDRLLTRDGHPLKGEALRRQERKFDHVVQERESETPSEREARIRKYESERAFVKDIPNAYTFSLTGEEPVSGRPAWVVKMTPRAEFTPTTAHSAMLKHIEGTLWIDKQDVQWAKAEARVIDPVNVAWFLARVERGTCFSVEQTRVADGLWMPQRITVMGSALVMMLHTKPIAEEMTWSGYRKANSQSASKAAPKTTESAMSKSFR